MEADFNWENYNQILTDAQERARKLIDLPEVKALYPEPSPEERAFDIVGDIQILRDYYRNRQGGWSLR
jgi:hypothetical protein